MVVEVKQSRNEMCTAEWMNGFAQLTSVAGGRCAEGASRTPGATMAMIGGVAWHGGPLEGFQNGNRSASSL